MNLLEIFGVILALFYVVLAMWEHPLCWIAALLSSLCYLEVFYSARLYTESALQLFFIALSLQGLRRWQKISADNISECFGEEITISHLPFSFQVQQIMLSSICAVILGYGVYYSTGARFAFIDSLITVFSIYATYLTTEKIIENWLYWIAIDTVASILYMFKGLFLTAGLYGIYVILATAGFMQWKKAMQKDIIYE